MNPVVRGVQWKHGAVGNARWTGVRVKDPLEKAGLMDGFEGKQERNRPQLCPPSLENRRPDAGFSQHQQAGGAPSRFARSLSFQTTEQYNRQNQTLATQSTRPLNRGRFSSACPCSVRHSGQAGVGHDRRCGSHRGPCACQPESTRTRGRRREMESTAGFCLDSGAYCSGSYAHQHVGFDSGEAQSVRLPNGRGPGLPGPRPGPRRTSQKGIMGRARRRRPRLPGPLLSRRRTKTYSVS